MNFPRLDSPKHAVLLGTVDVDDEADSFELVPLGMAPAVVAEHSYLEEVV